MSSSAEAYAAAPAAPPPISTTAARPGAPVRAASQRSASSPVSPVVLARMSWFGSVDGDSDEEQRSPTPGPSSTIFGVEPSVFWAQAARALADDEGTDARTGAESSPPVRSRSLRRASMPPLQPAQQPAALPAALGLSTGPDSAGPASPALSPLPAPAKARRRPTGTGILSRLRRINKREAREAQKHSLDAPVPSPALPATPDAVAAPPLEAIESVSHASSTVSAEEKTTDGLPSLSSEPARPRSPIVFKDLPGVERTPHFVYDGSARPSRERIHSLQPSLVDEESVRADSDEEEGEEGALNFDEEWLEQRVEERRRDEFGDASAESAPSAGSWALQPADLEDAATPMEGTARHEAPAPAAVFATASPSTFTLGQPPSSAAERALNRRRQPSIPGAFTWLPDAPTGAVSPLSTPLAEVPPLEGESKPAGESAHPARESSEYADAHSRHPSQDEPISAPPVESAAVAGPPAAQLLALSLSEAKAQSASDEVDTPRGHAAQRTSYFEATAHSRSTTAASTTSESSVPVSISDSTKAASEASSLAMAAAELSEPPRFHAAPPATYSWLRDAELAPVQLYCLVREMVAKQLRWELDRAWLLDGISAPTKPAALGRDELAIFRKRPSFAALPRPRLPIVHFLLARALSTCPMFSPASADAPDVHRFVTEGVLPLLRKRQDLSLSEPVDRHGEGDGSDYSAKSTLNVASRAVSSLLVRYISAALRKGLLRPSTAQIAAAPWPRLQELDMIMPPSAYVAHRQQVSQLKQGGMEVDIISLRARSSTDCEFLLSVRRYGFPVVYVLRSEEDFFQFARSLAAELGPKARVRPLPPRWRGSGTDAGDAGSLGPLTGNAALESQRRSSVASIQSILSPRNAGVEKLVSVQSSRSSVNVDSASGIRPPRYGRPQPKRSRSSDSTGSGLGLSPASVQSPPDASTSQISLTASERGLPRGRSDPYQAASPDLTMPLSPVVASVRNAEPPASGDKPPRRSRIFSGRRASSRGTSPSGAKPEESTLSPAGPATAHHELRRHHLRAWLRDALAVRGAGHSSETQAFLSLGSFTDKEMRPGTRADVEVRRAMDETKRADREAVAAGAAAEALELHDELKALWRACTEGDEALRVYAAIRASSTFSALPLPYQRVVSLANLRLAHGLFGVFVSGSESGKNLQRAQDLFHAFPWRSVSQAMHQPAGIMLQRARSAIAGGDFVDRLLAVLLEDGGLAGMQTELADLKRRFGSTIMRKIENFVEMQDAQKRLVRQSAETACIPLVAAIARGSDTPRLTPEGVQRIVKATRAHREFAETLPSDKEVAAKLKANVDVRLIYDMQRALRLLSLRRDATLVRETLQLPEIKGALEILFEPLMHAIRRMHRSVPLASVVDDLRDFLARLLDVLSGLRSRVQEPWRSVSTIATLLDDAVPAWYSVLHSIAEKDNLVEELFAWLHSLARIVGSGTPDVSLSWAPPLVPPSSAGKPAPGAPQASSVQVDELRRDLSELEAASRRRAVAEMRETCRWAAGDVDAYSPIQLQGAGGKTRTDPILAPPVKPAAPTPSLDRFRPGFRTALARVLR